MYSAVAYTLISVLIVSLISLIGIFTLSLKTSKLKNLLIYLVSFSAGALLGDVFIHMLPEMVEEGFSLSISVYILVGIVIFFILEKIVHWHHNHLPVEEGKAHVHPFAYTNLIGDGLHNFLDGIIIAAAYIVNIPVGIATTLAVLLHEIPQEIGDYGVLIHAGFSKTRALFLNFLTALTSIVGAIVALLLNNYVEGIQYILVPIAAGGFVYIAGSDLIPELHKERAIGKSILQTIAFVLGISVMVLMILFE